MGTALNPTGGSWWSIPVTLTQSLVYLGLALLWPAGWGSRQDRGPGRFGGPEGPRVRFPLGPEVARRGQPSPRAVTIGIWCNWQHDWFWSS